MQQQRSCCDLAEGGDLVGYYYTASLVVILRQYGSDLTGGPGTFVTLRRLSAL